VNELIQSLIETLKKEAGHYRSLAVLAEGQKELLVAGKVESLPENVRLEEKEVFALNPLVAQRNELLAQMAKAYRVKSLSLSEALQKAPVESIEEFKKAVIELVQSAKILEEINQSNEKLLNNALSYVNFTLKIIANGGKKKAFSPSATREEETSSFVNRIV
jgi:flagellar biosynthesis/type III secretory pathway chaperone